jgi:Zn finger protein HypA/HybF involved in hydrogenase expression
MKTIYLISIIFLSFSGLVHSVELSAKHQEMGFECKTCHVEGMTAPKDETCLSCHGPLQDLVNSTSVERKPFDTKISPNPHDSAHYGTTLSCFACHSEHKEAKIYCNTCHSFDYKNFK